LGTGADNKWRYEIKPAVVRDKLNDLWDKLKDPERPEYVTLNRVWKIRFHELLDESLFNAYPQIRNFKIVFVEDPHLEYQAKYQKDKEQIIVNLENLYSAEVFSILEHEVQHVIQSLEGFARGSNSVEVKSIYKELWNRTSAALYQRQQKLLENNAEYQELSKKFDELSKNGLSKDGETEHIASRMQAIEAEVRKNDALAAKLSQLSDEYYEKYQNDWLSYRQVAGETEARTAEDRVFMEAKKKRTLCLWMRCTVMSPRKIWFSCPTLYRL